MAGDIQSKLKEGINAARIGDKTTARRLLIQVTSADPRNEAAFMWLASVTDDIPERKRFLQRVLEINPTNARAREALTRLGGDTSRAAQDRQTVNNLRQMQAGRTTGRIPPVTAGAPQSINPLVALIGLLVALGIVSVIIFLVVAATATPGTQEQPTDILLLSTATITPLPSPSPFGVVITPDPSTQRAALPPTFTPTASPTPSRTPLPTATQIPLNTFTLLYTVGETGDLFQADGEAGEARRIGEQVRDVAYDRGGTRLAFVRDVPCATDETITAPEVFVASTTDVANAVQITSLCASDTGHPSWGSDGVSLVYYTNYGGDDTEIFTMTDDGQNQRALTENEFNDTDPVWSPDGTLIVYVMDNGPEIAPDLLESEIYAIQMPEALPESIAQLTNDARSSYAPEFSHDGTQIVFVSDRGGDGDIYIMDARGDGETLLTAADEGAEDRAPSFTPDARSIIFLSNRDGERFQMYLVEVQFTTITALSTVNDDVTEVHYKPETAQRRLGT